MVINLIVAKKTYGITAYLVLANVDCERGPFSNTHDPCTRGGEPWPIWKWPAVTSHHMGRFRFELLAFHHISGATWTHCWGGAVLDYRHFIPSLSPFQDLKTYMYWPSSTRADVHRPPLCTRAFTNVPRDMQTCIDPPPACLTYFGASRRCSLGDIA